VLSRADIESCTPAAAVVKPVLVHRKGQAVVVEPVDELPEGYVESFAGVPDDFTRPSQGDVEKRTSLG